MREKALTDKDAMDIAGIRQLNQQLVSPEFSDAGGVVRWMGMLQAQDYLSLPWAVGVRMKNPSLKRFTDDFNAGRIIRTHLFRNTIQLVCSEDLPWMQMLYHQRGMAVEKWAVKTFAEIDNARNIKIRDEIVRMLEGGNYLTKAELDTRLRTQFGIELDNRTLIHLLRVCEFDRQICSGPIVGRYATFAVQGERVPQISMPTKEEAMAMLARRYFKSHAPATLVDFQWWCAMTKTDCQKAIESIRDELHILRHTDSTYYLHEDCRVRGGGKDNRQLLPPFDEYIIGYKTRHHVISGKYAGRAYNSTGIFWPTLLADSQIVGTWNKALALSFFEENQSQSFANAVRRYSDFPLQ